jgi:hypothetical protein
MPRLFSRDELEIMDNMTATNEVVLVSLGGKPELPEVIMEKEKEARDEEVAITSTLEEGLPPLLQMRKPSCEDGLHQQSAGLVSRRCAWRRGRDRTRGLRLSRIARMAFGESGAGVCHGRRSAMEQVRDRTDVDRPIRYI